MKLIDPSCRQRRADEANFEAACYRLEEEAENAERQARLADEEARKLAKAMDLIMKGELSRASRELPSRGFGTWDRFDFG